MMEYSIKELSQLTGIKDFTIRTWEKRYKMSLPERGDNKARKYKENDLHNFLRIAALIKRGYRISEIVEMSQDEMSAKIGMVFVPKRMDLKINRLMKLAQTFSDTEFDKELKHEIIDSGLEAAITNVIIPMMEAMEAKYIQSADYLAVKQFAYDTIRRRLIVAADVEEQEFGEKVLIFSPMQDSSELSLLITDYMIKKYKKTPIYCGDNVKVAQAKSALQKSECSKIVMVGHFYDSTEDLAPQLDAFAKVEGAQKFVLDKNAISYAHKYPSLTFLQSVNDLKKQLQS
jgi:DNA-binding transcriptional MerR regulator